MSGPVAIRDSGNVRDLNDVARPTENTVRDGASCPCRSIIRAHRCESALRSLLLIDLIFLPLLRFQLLLLPPLLDPESPEEKHSQSHESHSAYYATCDRSHIGLAGRRSRDRVCDAGHV